MVIFPVSPSRIRSCGRAIVLLSESECRKSSVTEGIGPTDQAPDWRSRSRLFSGTDCLPSPKVSASDFEVRSNPSFCSVVRSSSSSSMSTRISPFDLSFALTIRSATLIRSGVSRTVIALRFLFSARRRISSSWRSSVWISCVSAFER